MEATLYSSRTQGNGILFGEHECSLKDAKTQSVTLSNIDQQLFTNPNTTVEEIENRVADLMNL